MSPRQKQRRLDIDDRHWQLLKILAASLNTSTTQAVEWAIEYYAEQYKDHVVGLFEFEPLDDKEARDETQGSEGQ